MTEFVGADDNNLANDTYVYVFNVFTTNVKKIGISNDVPVRKRTLENQTGYTLEHLGSSVALKRHEAAAIEKLLHSIHARKCVHGEFFEISHQELLNSFLILADFGFGPPYEYLGSLLPRRFDPDSKHRKRMVIGYERVWSLQEYLDVKERVYRDALHRFYIDFPRQWNGWKWCKMDLRPFDELVLCRRANRLRLQVREGTSKKIRLVRAKHDVIWI